MKGRPNIHQNEEIVSDAQQVFWKKGYFATSLTDLSKATGAGAGSLYNNFKGGKKELFSKALQQRRVDFRAFKAELDKSDSPVDLIKNFFLNLADADFSSHQKGCIIANTLVEMSFTDEQLESEAAEILKETEALYKSAIEREKENNKLTTAIPADVLAKYLVTFWCGINSLRRLYPDRTILREQIKLHLEILK
jgi:TetR/AcrR family transcriptional repressor of nem operon